MSKGLALCIGLNSVDPQHYKGWSGTLSGCEFDAKDMAALVQTQGFSPTLLLTKDATRQHVAELISKMAQDCNAGDSCMISYAGHGSQLPDLDGDEVDGQDETWCLFNGEQFDDELYSLLSLFDSGVRVLIVSDSCHSGSVTKNRLILRSLEIAALATSGANLMSLVMEPKIEIMPVYRAMPNEIATRVYLANQPFYEPLLRDPRFAHAKERVQASCLLLSACKDEQLAGDGAFNGKFTGALKYIWNGGKFKGSYPEFVKKIEDAIEDLEQTPQCVPLGRDTDTFQAQQPFTI